MMITITRNPTLDRAFGALAHPIRRELLARLGREGRPVPVGDLAAPFDVSLVAVSKHLKVLREAGLVDREVVGRERRYRLDPRGFAATAEWLEVHRQFWEDRLERLASHVETGNMEEENG